VALAVSLTASGTKPAISLNSTNIGVQVSPSPGNSATAVISPPGFTSVPTATFAVGKAMLLLLLLLTAVWLYAGHRHLQYCRYVQRRARDRLPEYRAMRDGRPKGPVPSLSIITYSIPSLAGIVWILFLFVALVQDV